MDPQDLSSYKTLFIKTAREFLDLVEEQIKIFTQNPADKNAVETLIRGAHSIKGQARLMGYQKTGDLAEHLEKKLRSISEGSQAATASLTSAVTEGFSALRTSIDTIEKENKEADVTEEIRKLEI